jgi:hypothetical protein
VGGALGRSNPLHLGWPTGKPLKFCSESQLMIHGIEHAMHQFRTHRSAGKEIGGLEVPETVRVWRMRNGGSVRFVLCQAIFAKWNSLTRIALVANYEDFCSYV